MNSLKRSWIKSEIFVVKNPKSMIVIAFIIGFFAFTVVETVRAAMYIDAANEYKYSARILSLQDKINRLDKMTKDQPNSVYCQIDTQLLVDAKLSPEAVKSAEKVSRELHELAQKISPAPSFRSFFSFIPEVSAARTTSAELKKSVSEIIYLTREDSRSVYCSELVDSLSEIYYVQTLSTPQGVAALHVAQQDNFKTNVSIAQQRIAQLRPPEDFTAQHSLINDYLNNVRLGLQGDTAQIEQFSRAIERDTELLDAIFVQIQSKSQDLDERSSQLLILGGVFSVD